MKTVIQALKPLSLPILLGLGLTFPLSLQASDDIDICSESFWVNATVGDMATIPNPDHLCPGQGGSFLEFLMEQNGEIGMGSSGFRIVHLVTVSSEPVVLEFLKKNPDIHAKDQYGITPLRLASYLGKPQVVEILLAAGADVNAQSIYGYGVLYGASKNGHAEVVEMLLSAGADPNDNKNIFGSSPLLGASFGGHAEVVEILLAAGADVNARSKSGFSPLLGASANGRAEVLRILLAAGADLDVVSHFKRESPLLKASMNGHDEVVKILLAAGVDPNVKNDRGESPLYWALENGHTRVAEILIFAGAKKKSWWKFWKKS